MPEPNVQRVPAVGTRFIPSLDGLRAIAVLTVIFAHSRGAWLDSHTTFLYPLRQGGMGVEIFFVISGFLITKLMLKEQDKTGGLSLKRFYAHRAFRILPPFYVYLAAVGIRIWLGIDHVDGPSFASAALYYWNYYFHASGLILGHLWSLSLEEQFYLLWPICLLLWNRRTCLRIALSLVVVMPFSRLLTYLYLPASRGHIDMMLHTHIDTIMCGCVLALAFDRHWRLFEKANRGWWFLASVVFLFAVEPVLIEHYRGTWRLMAGFTLESLSATIIVLYAVTHKDNLVGRILNNPVLRHIGVISYGLYLWQQMFTFNEPLSWVPLNLIPIFLCAELSYFLVEKPMRSLRDGLVAKPERMRAAA
jgi:peptidoglycan/LPS O-acetylase OafA/YrhL